MKVVDNYFRVWGRWYIIKNGKIIRVKDYFKPWYRRYPFKNPPTR